MTKHKKDFGDLVYSTDHGRMCPGCSRPIDDCVCRREKPVPKGDGIVRVGRETRGRKGKGVTVITGVPLDHEELLTPGAVTEFRIRLGATACRFLRGHRIRLEITSSDFPNHDRNHNTGGSDLADTRLVAAQQEMKYFITLLG